MTSTSATTPTAGPRRRGVLVALAVVCGAMFATVPAAPAAAADPFTVGYVWSSQATPAGCFNASATYSYNSRGLTNSICRTGVGAYTVHFPGLASPGGNVQVTAYGSTPAGCKVLSWVPSGTVEQVSVRCFTNSGVPVDSLFTASFTAGGGAGNTVAFLWANNPTAASYTSHLTYQYNNRGGPATITHTTTGWYTILFPDNVGPVDAGSVKVTAHGSGSGVCHPGAFAPHASGTAMQVSVFCQTAAGVSSDEKFSVVYMNGMNHVASNVMATGYARDTSPSASSYTPPAAFQRSTTLTHSGTVTIASPQVGVYDVNLPFQDEGLDGGHAQAVFFGGPFTNRCQIGFWGNVTGGRRVRVLCFTRLGDPIDAMFMLHYTAKIQNL